MNDGDPTAPSWDRGESPRSGRDGSGPRSSPAFLIAATIVALVFFNVGTSFGYPGAIALTRGAEGVLVMAVAATIVGAIAVVLAIVGGVALAFKATRPVGKISLVAAAAVVAGAVAAAVAVPALGIRSEPSASTPASLYTTTNATVSLTLVNEPEFVPRSDGATCSWVIDGGAIDGIGAPDVGTLRGRMLSAQIRPGLEAEGSLIVLGIQAADVDDLGLPKWTGAVPMTSTDGGHAGSVDFADLPIEPQKPEYVPDASWPQTLTGTLTWTCD